MNDKNTLNIGVKSCLLGDKMRNKEAINSRRNRIYLLKADLPTPDKGKSGDP